MAKKREGKTTIQIDDKIKEQLNSYKVDDESYNDIIKRTIIPVQELIEKCNLSNVEFAQWFSGRMRELNNYNYKKEVYKNNGNNKRNGTDL